jgi:hypothetical protein
MVAVFSRNRQPSSLKIKTRNQGWWWVISFKELKILYIPYSFFRISWQYWETHCNWRYVMFSRSWVWIYPYCVARGNNLVGMYQSAWRHISEYSRSNIKLLNSTGPFLRRKSNLDERTVLIPSEQWLPCVPTALSCRKPARWLPSTPYCYRQSPTWATVTFGNVWCMLCFALSRKWLHVPAAYICMYKGVQLKSEVEHSETWSAASWPSRRWCYRLPPLASHCAFFPARKIFDTLFKNLFVFIFSLKIFLKSEIS